MYHVILLKAKSRLLSLSSYLQVIVQTAAQVHLSERHVGQFGMKEDSELGADVQRRPPGNSLLLGGDVHVALVELPQMLLQGKTHPSANQVRLSGAAASHGRSTHGSAQTV